MSKLLVFRIQFIEVMKLQEDQRVDATYKIGKTTIHIVAPRITTEEKDIRIEGIKQLVWELWLQVESADLYDQESKCIQ